MVWFITFLAAVLIFLAAGAKRRASKRFDLPSENPALSLAILKENLLENPSTIALEKLNKFAVAQGLKIPEDEYPLEKAKSIESDDELFLRQSLWLDFLTPIEFKEAASEHAGVTAGDANWAEKKFVNGILRLYSDEKIFAAFAELEQKFPNEKTRALKDDYDKLCVLRDNSKADYDSLENLRIEKEKWEKEMREIAG